MSQDNEQDVMRTEYDFTSGIRGKHPRSVSPRDE